jgi:hypothetical protein
VRETKLNLSKAYIEEIVRMSSFVEEDLIDKTEYELKTLLDNIVMGVVR